MTSISRKPDDTDDTTKTPIHRQPELSTDDTTKTPIYRQPELHGHELERHLNRALKSHDDEKTLSYEFITGVAEEMVDFINARQLVQNTIDDFIKVLHSKTKITPEDLKMIQLYIDVFDHSLLRSTVPGSTTPKVKLEYKIQEISEILERLSSASLPKMPGGSKRKKKSNKNQSMRRKSNKNQSRKRKSRN